MANLKDIKRRIGSVKSTQKITNAMKLVSAAKFARAGQAVEGARPYAQALDQVVAQLLDGQEELVSPFLAEREEKRAMILMLATDRGLCGGLNANLAKALQSFVNEKKKQGTVCEIYACGRRATLFAKKANLGIVKSMDKVLEQGNIQMARSLALDVFKLFHEGGFDRIYIAYPHFRSALDQTPTIDQLLPVDLSARKSAGDTAIRSRHIVEPTLAEMLDMLLERKMVSTVYSALLSSVASEHSARMTAMDAATNNAKEVIRKLTLQYNRARQAAITKELIEIISGAEAL